MRLNIIVSIFFFIFRYHLILYILQSSCFSCCVILKVKTTVDARFNEGIFCAWNGEPLWLLEDYETTNDIEDLC